MPPSKKRGVSTSRSVYKRTASAKRHAKSMAARSKHTPKVSVATKQYVAKKLDARIPDVSFTQRRDYFTNSGITNADLYPLLGYSGTSQHFGINIPHNLVRPSEDDGTLNSTLDQHFTRGVRLKSLRIKGELSLPSDWFLKGTGYSYLRAHIWVFERKRMKGHQSSLSASDLFVKKNEVGSNGSSGLASNNAIQGQTTAWDGSWADSLLRWNSDRYKLLTHRELFMTGGTTAITDEDFFGTTLPAGFGTGSHGASMPQHMRKKFSINVPCPKYLKWDMNQYFNNDVDDNTAPEFQPFIAIGYQREGGIDVIDAMLEARYTVDCRVEPPASLSV